MSDRSFDLVLYGATGFTGRLVAQRLAQMAPEGFTWALAGRGRARLDAVAEELSLGDIPRLLADSTDPDSLTALAESARVVVTTVGPYLKYGFELAHACAKAGTHYADLTGEVPFMQHTIRSLHAMAQDSGARIVHTCGYDSIPSDMGTWAVQQAMIADGSPARTVRTFVGPSRGGLSGGTAASMIEVMKVAEDRQARKAMADPYALDPEGDRGRADTWDPVRPMYDDTLGQHVAPFFMGPVNTRVVRRSHALLGRPWGTDFSYTEVMAAGSGARGAATAWGITAGMGAFLGAASNPALRDLLQRRVLPSPGDGPDAEARERGFFRHLVAARGADPSHRRIARVIGDKDPGYGATAGMLAAAGLTLALDTDHLPDRAGVLTPSTAMGDALLPRLAAGGVTIEVEEWPEGTVKP